MSIQNCRDLTFKSINNPRYDKSNVDYPKVIIQNPYRNEINCRLMEIILLIISLSLDGLINYQKFLQE
jgi:hypothetical protein